MFAITNIGYDDVIIGIDWLREHNPEIDWAEGTVKMSRCPPKCSRHSKVKGHMESMKFERSIYFAGTEQEEDSLSEEEEGPEEVWLTPMEKDSFKLSATKTNIATRLAQEAEQPGKSKKLLEELIPSQYHEYLSVFSEEASYRLAEHSQWDHTIDFNPTKPVPKPAKVYPLTQREQEALDEFLEEKLNKGHLRPAKSSMASPVFFVEKKETGKLRLVVDYRELNKATLTNKYPLPLISDILDVMEEANYFTELDLRNGYHNLRIKEGDEWKAATYVHQ